MIFPLTAQAALVTYIGPDGGDWKIKANWDAGYVPGEGGHTNDQVRINNNPANVKVILTGYPTWGYDVTLNDVTVDAGDQLTITNINGYIALRLSYSLTNNGIVHIESFNNNGCTLAGSDYAQVVLTGEGTMGIYGGPTACLKSWTGGFLNDTSHTIRGGRGARIEAPLTNRGKIIADDGTLTLWSFPVTNLGELRADNATMQFNCDLTNLPGGLLSLNGSNSIMYFDGHTLTDPRFNIGDGTVHFYGGTLINPQFSPGKVEVFSSGLGCTLKGNILLAGTDLSTDSQATLILSKDNTTADRGYVYSNGSYTPVDYPGVAPLTTAYGINNAGQIVGMYRDSVVDTRHGFLLSENVYSSFDYPGSVATYAQGINSAGQIVGYYSPGDVLWHAYTLSGGVYTNLDTPGALTTYANGINDSGQIVGNYYLGSMPTGRMHGYLLSGGIKTPFDYPGANHTNAFGINNAGQIVGSYSYNINNYNYVMHAFLLSGGVYTSLDIPGAQQTEAYGINDNGIIVGSYQDSAGTWHGFVSSPYQTLDPPGSTSTYAYGINNSGQIVGSYKGTRNSTAGAYVNSNGTIHLNGTSNGSGGILVDSDTLATLTGGGTLEMTWGNVRAWPNGRLINDADHTIRGYGFLGDVTNRGQIIVEKGILTISGALTGPGSISVSDNATLHLHYPIQAGDFFMNPLANLNNEAGKAIELKGNFSFAQTDPAAWTWWWNASLVMSGAGPQQSLEVGGRDYGPLSTGFSNNFNLPALNLAGSGTYVNLVDNIDNGHRASHEALYVNSLSVPTGTTLNLNNLHLYTYYPSSSTIYRVKAGDGGKFGGGKIIDVSVKPGPRSVPGIITPLLLD